MRSKLYRSYLFQGFAAEAVLQYGLWFQTNKLNNSIIMQAAAKYKPNIEVACDSETLALRALEVFVDDAEKAIQSKGKFYTAISGGRTPRRLFELLGETPSAKELSWDRIHLFWVDERCVPPDSQSSNYRLAADTFLNKIPIPGENIHRIPTEHRDSRISSQHYEETIRSVFCIKEDQIPQFDLIVLGMGKDGHTGSLLPNSYAPFATESLACVVYVLDEKLNRITLTYPVLRAASHLAVLVCGGDKADILKRVFTAEPDEVKYPIHILWPVLEKVTWLVDAEATRLLDSK
ncbi:MAG: 6-phosphogluconolactonase [Sedimentisphaerales bacterium]|nr:6-phosphogluconolactonase [Sedimentisphaerales bacterium]